MLIGDPPHSWLSYINPYPPLTHTIEMQDALRDERRSKNFKEFAEKALVGENVHFLLAVLKYKHVAELCLIESSKGAK